MDAKHLQRVVPVLKLLQTMNSEDRIKMIPHLADDVQDGISECILNATCNKSIPMELRKLIKKETMKDAEKYKYLLKPNTSSRKRHAKLQQIGGSGLGLILRAVVPILDKISQKGEGSSCNKKLKKKESESEDSEEEEEESEEEEDSEEEEETEEETEEEEETSEESEEED